MIIRKRFVFSLLLFLLIQLTVTGQEQGSGLISSSKHALGFAAGITTGYGLSYQFLPNKFGARFTFAPVSQGNTMLYSMGVTLIYQLHESERSNIFIYQGNHYIHTSFNSNDNTHEYFNNGIGVGIEFVIFDRIGYNIMGGFAVIDNFSTLFPTIESGLYYKL